jgi:hypothetical protein
MKLTALGAETGPCGITAAIRRSFAVPTTSWPMPAFCPLAGLGDKNC